MKRCKERRKKLFELANQALKYGIMVLCVSALLCQQGSYADGSIIHPLYSSDLAAKAQIKPKPIQHFGFDDQLTDSQSRWQFLGKGYRAYNPMLHRFMAQDSMSPFDKGGINGYVFARNNPIMAYDPTGHFSWSALLLQLVPHTVGGFAGWAVGSVIAGGLGVAAGALMSSKALAMVGFALIGAISSAGGAYVGQGIDTGNWHPQTSLASAALLGAGLGAAGAYLGSKGPSAPMEEETAPPEATCFTKDTLVQLANKKEQAIANIQLGTMVMTGYPSSIGSRTAGHTKEPAPPLIEHKKPNDGIEPIIANKWKEVDLSYFSVINGKRYQNSIDLLRPITWLHQHGMDKVGNTITLSLLKFGINRVKAYVVAIKPTKIDTREINWSKVGSRPVIGTFKRYAPDVRTYTLRDSKGHSDHIHATPNHPFYVQNKHGFVAIEDVKDTDVLVGMGSGTGTGTGTGTRTGTRNYDGRGNGNGNRGVSTKRYGRLDNDANSHDRLDGVVHLVCAKGIHSHCGKPYKHPMAVYNLEVYRRHVFRVGVQGVVVHNCQESYDQRVISQEPVKKFTLYLSKNYSTDELGNEIFRRLSIQEGWDIIPILEKNTYLDPKNVLTDIIRETNYLDRNHELKKSISFINKQLSRTPFKYREGNTYSLNEIKNETSSNDKLNPVFVNHLKKAFVKEIIIGPAPSDL